MPGKWIIVLGGIGALGLAAAFVTFVLLPARAGCSSHDDVTARVAIVSSGLQQAAATGEMPVERLAEGITRLNSAATSYETTKDHQAYCDALDALSAEFKVQD